MHTSSNFIPSFNPHSPLYRNPHTICSGLVPRARFEIALGIFCLQIISQARRLEPLDNSIAATLKVADQLPPAEQSHHPCPTEAPSLQNYPDTPIVLQLLGTLQRPRSPELQRRQSSVPHTSNCVIKQMAP